MSEEAHQSAPLNDDELREALKSSAEMKEEGNKFFLDKNYTSAVTAYNQAIACLPKPRPKTLSEHTDNNDIDSDDKEPESEPKPIDVQTATDIQSSDRDHRMGGAAASEHGQNTQEATVIASSTPTPDLQLTPLERECSNTRVILYANIAACELKMEAWEAAVKAATAALEEDPHHQKSLWRRAKANEAIDSWSSLTSAEKDYKTLMEIVPTSQPLYRDTSSMLRGMGPRIEAARKRDTDKMLGQLKEVGNSMLGWFGLSTDNFKMTPNGEGGYSMNFVNNP